MPRITFINKMDREGASFEGTVREMESRLGATPVVIQIPVGEGPAHVKNAFRGIIDLVSMEMLSFPPAGEGKVVSPQPIPEEEVDRADMWRETLLEKLYDFSNELMELALQEQPVPADLLRKTIREATVQGLVQPVLCGSALNGIGVPPLLDAVAWYLPSPADRPAVEGTTPAVSKKKEAPPGLARRAPRDDEPFAGLVFKVLPAKTGDLCLVRIYSGQLKANSRVYNPGRDKENAGPVVAHAGRAAGTGCHRDDR